MVNTAAFGKRIQEIMKFYHVSASGFADAMGVGRSSISHILSGRNKPSLDFVMKITEAYPEAELHWLLYGTGVFPKSSEIDSSTELQIKKPTPSSTPSEITNPKEIDQDLFSTSLPEKLQPPDNKDEEIQKPFDQHLSKDKEINKIVFFYKDGTFEVYKN